MDYDELIKAVKRDTGLSEDVVRTAAASLFGNIRNAMRMDGEVTLKGFGRFYMLRSNCKTGYDFANRSVIKVIPKAKAKFKAYESFYKEY